MATWMKASLLWVVRSYSFDSRRYRPSQPNVRSTIHRFGWTTNPTRPASFRTTTPTHPHLTHPWAKAVSKCESPHTTFSRFTAARNRSISLGPPARSWVSAGTTSNAHSRPRVSTATNRLRPATFFSPVVPVRAAVLGPLDRLAVHKSHRRPRLLPGGLTDLRTEGIVDLVPGAVLLPPAEGVEHNPVRWQVVRKGPPHAPVAGLVQDGVNHLPASVSGGPAARLGGGYVRLDQPPLAVGQVGRVWRPAHA